MPRIRPGMLPPKEINGIFIHPVGRAHFALLPRAVVAVMMNRVLKVCAP